MLGYDDSRLKFINYVGRLSASLGIPSIDFEDGIVLYSLLYSYIGMSKKCNFVVDAGSGIGYSTLWLAYAVLDHGMQNDCKIISIDIVDSYVKKSMEIFRSTELDKFIHVVRDDACKVLESYPPLIDFIFLDIDNRDYIKCISPCINRIVNGGYIVAHNAYFPFQEYSRRFVEYLRSNGLKVTIIPTRMGLILATKDQ